MYGDLHCWLILGSDYEVTLSLLNDTEFTVTTDLTVAIKESENETYVLYDVYNPCKYRGGLLNSTFLGSWTNRGGLVVNLTQEKFLRRENLWGLTLRIIALVRIGRIHPNVSLIFFRKVLNFSFIFMKII